jgi:hypothetical protein
MGAWASADAEASKKARVTTLIELHSSVGIGILLKCSGSGPRSA